MNTTLKICGPEQTENLFSGQFRRITALAFLIGTVAGAAAAGGFSLGGGGVSVGIGGGSLVDVDVDVGGVGANVTVGGGSVANVDAHVGHIGANASVLGAGSLTSACVGACAAPPTTTPTTPPSTPVSTPAASTPNNAMTSQRLARLARKCSSQGNTDAFNGFSLLDRKGATMGWVHAAEIDRNLKIARLSFVGTNEKCMGLLGGNYKITSDQLRMN
jgi:hypothetical protein